jgi:hypothetical protein
MHYNESGLQYGAQRPKIVSDTIHPSRFIAALAQFWRPNLTTFFDESTILVLSTSLLSTTVVSPFFEVEVFSVSMFLLLSTTLLLDETISFTPALAEVVALALAEVVALALAAGVALALDDGVALALTASTVLPFTASFRPTVEDMQLSPEQSEDDVYELP